MGGIGTRGCQYHGRVLILSLSHSVSSATVSLFDDAARGTGGDSGLSLRGSFSFLAADVVREDDAAGAGRRTDLVQGRRHSDVTFT